MCYSAARLKVGIICILEWLQAGLEFVAFFFFFQTVEMSLHMAGFISFSSGKTHTQKSHYAGELALGEGQRERKMFLCIAFSSYHQARAQCC